LIPDKKIRQKILTSIEKLNKKDFNYPKLSEEIKKELLYKYFINDIKELEEITGKNLEIWYE